MTRELKAEEKLPRVTSFASSSEIPVAHDFFQRALPLVNKISVMFDWVILALVLMLVTGVLWLAFVTDYGSAYISDGILGCQVEPLNELEGKKVRDGIENNATGTHKTKK